MSIKKVAITAETVPIHTHLDQEIRPDRNWHELIEGWKKTNILGDKLGMLHRGFDVTLEKEAYGEKEYDRIDRLLFYFTNADGWDYHRLLELPTDGDKEYFLGQDSRGNTIRKTPSNLRQQLAQKAFDMLCLNFFSKVELLGEGRLGNEFNLDWERTIISERLFPCIQAFFRAEKERFGDHVKIRNLTRRDDKRSHNEKLAVDFLLKLAKFIWGWKEDGIDFWQKEEDQEETRKRNLETRSRLDASKPWMIEVLAYMGQLDILREWILELDEICLAKIREIALRNKFGQYQDPVRENRPVVTLDEACYLDSPPAWFLKKHELITREHKRLKGIQKAKQQKKEADRQIEKLTATER